MARTNYSKMSTQKLETEEVCASCAITFDEPEVPKKAVGTVTGCVKLNVRAKPNAGADVLEIIEVGDRVTVDEKSLGKAWYKVVTAKGTKGYCMKEYIAIV